MRFSWFRGVIVLCALGGIGGAILLLRAGARSSIVAFDVGLSGVIVLIGVLFEAGRYRPRVSSSDDWVMTHERFVDDATGKTMAVRYNPKTGERDYVEDRKRA